MENTSCLIALKPSYYTIIVQYTIFTVRPGNNRLPRYGTLTRGNTHFPRIYFPRTSGLPRGKHPHSAHLCLARSPHLRFGNLPIRRPGLGKLPTRQSMSSLWSTKLPTRVGIPLRLWGFASTIRTLTNTVCGLPKQAHKSLYIQLRSTALLSRAVDQSPSFWNNAMTDWLPFCVTAGFATSPAPITHNDTRSLGNLGPPTVDYNIWNTNPHHCGIYT